MKPIQFFSENGEYSANRLMYIFGCSLILLVWAFLSIKNNQIMIPDSIPFVFASLVAGKIIQRFAENNSPEIPPKN